MALMKVLQTLPVTNVYNMTPMLSAKSLEVLKLLLNPVWFLTAIFWASLIHRGVDLDPYPCWVANWVYTPEGKMDRINSQTSSIYLNNQVFGKVVNSKFVRSQHHVPPPPNASQSSQADELLISLTSPVAPVNATSTNTTTTTNTNAKTDWLNLVCSLNICSIVNKLNVFQSF